MRITNISGQELDLEIDLGHKVVVDVFQPGEVVRGITNHRTIRYFRLLEAFGMVKVEEDKVDWKEEGF